MNKNSYKLLRSSLHIYTNSAISVYKKMYFWFWFANKGLVLVLWYDNFGRYFGTMLQNFGDGFKTYRRTSLRNVLEIKKYLFINLFSSLLHTWIIAQENTLGATAKLFFAPILCFHFDSIKTASINYLKYLKQTKAGTMSTLYEGN